MDQIPHAAYFVALTFCLIQCRHCWRSLPLFPLSVVATIAWEYSYQPFWPEWLQANYTIGIVPVLCLRFLAVCEAVALHSFAIQYRRLLIGTAVCFGLLFAAIMAWAYVPKDTLHTAIQLRRIAIIGMAGFLISYTVLPWSVRQWRSGFYGTHVILLAILCSTMAAASILRMAFPNQVWHGVDQTAICIAAVLYFTWAYLLSPPAPQPYPLPRSAID